MEKIIEPIVLTDTFDAHQDWSVPIPGFVIVASKDATKKSLDDFSDNELLELISVIKKIRLAMRQVLSIETVYVFQNEDSAHGFHMWLFPRYSWMEKFGTKIESVRPIMEYAEKNLFSDAANMAEVGESARKVREYLSSK